MEIKGEAKLLRIFLSDTDKLKNTLLYEAIVFAAHRYNIAGATVFKGVMGYGSSSVIHSVKFWEIDDKLPVVVELIDDAEKIDRFLEKILPWIENLRYGCLITSEKANIVLHKQGRKKRFFPLIMNLLT